jgi:hypothetical protein
MELRPYLVVLTVAHGLKPILVVVASKSEVQSCPVVLVLAPVMTKLRETVVLDTEKLTESRGEFLIFALSPPCFLPR